MSTAPNPPFEPSTVITPAKIEWQTDDTGNQVPVSGEFGDVYFSHADGLAESRYVFLAHNQLPTRLANLTKKQCFTIAELGFGTGLNLLATWQLWRQLRDTNPQLAAARLHVITTEKFPIPLTDLRQILALWAQRAPELSDVIEQLLSAYPPLIAGCHRLSFFEDNLTVDLWLGDAADSLSKLTTHPFSPSAPYVDAWFLDGFAPSCNHTLWAERIFAQIQRLSRPTTTAATYSCAGTVKRALQACGFQICKVKGFGRKREMLTAVMTETACLDGRDEEHHDSDVSSTHSGPIAPSDSTLHHHSINHTDTAPMPTHSIVIGAGVSGLLTAWSLANRGLQVTLLDKSAPLAGASGNPRALLAPKMTPIHHVDEHLHSIGYLYSSRLYRHLNTSAAAAGSATILEPTGALDLLTKANVSPEQIAAYPDEMATTLSAVQAQQLTGIQAQDLSKNLYLPQSGLVNPQALKTRILTHPLIRFLQLMVTDINETTAHVCVAGHDKDNQAISVTADHAVICAAFESHQLDQRVFDCRKIRGQLSWFIPATEQRPSLPKIPLKYGGYCAAFIAQTDDAQLNHTVEGQPHFLLGASFVRNDTDTSIRPDEHQISRDKLITAMPELQTVIPTDTSLWQGRAGIRTQTPDYHPIVGALADSRRIWAMSAMGAKGYALAPICAEALADMMLGTFAPLSAAMLARLAPTRSRLQTPLT